VSIKVVVFPLSFGPVQYALAPLFITGMHFICKGVGVVIYKTANFSLISGCNFVKGIGSIAKTVYRRCYVIMANILPVNGL
jgi:hypothetical protein